MNLQNAKDLARSEKTVSGESMVRIIVDIEREITAEFEKLKKELQK